MKKVKGCRSFAIQPDPSSAQVRSFWWASAQHRGLTLDSLDSDCMARNRQCLTEVPVLPLMGYRAHPARTQRLESRI